MSQEIIFKDTFSGVVDGVQVASMYRAYAEDTQPYVICLEQSGYEVAGALEPTGNPGVDRDYAVQWVRALTELVAKARAYEAVNTVDECGAEEAPPVFLDKAFVVDELTDIEVDMEWVDCDEDHYRNIDGEWYISYGGDQPWKRVVDEDFLCDNAPYRAVL